MNQTRSFLMIAWLAVAALLWIEWNKPAPVAATTPTPVAAAPATGASVPPPGALAPAPAPGAVPAAAASGNPLAAAPSAVGTSAASTSAPRLITLESDTLLLRVDLSGGRVVDSQLLQYQVEKKAGSPHVHLLSNAENNYFAADAGLISVDAKAAQRDLLPQFQTMDGANLFKIAPGASELAVPLTWTDPQSGITVSRTLRLVRGSYILDVDDMVANRGSQAQRLYPVVGLSRVAPPAPPRHSFLTNPDALSFVGGVWYSPDAKYKKVAFTDFSSKPPGNAAVDDGWIGMLQHHFASAWVPFHGDVQTRFETAIGSHDGAPLYTIRSIGAPLDVAPGKQVLHRNRLWVGPKLQGPMAEVSPTLRLTVDYGKLTVLAQPLFWLLSMLHRLLGNWGWAIVAIVVLLKAALYPLSRKQYQSMAKMRSVQPRIEALRERYGEDKQALNLAMMELYKKEKINPIGGCLPILVQMPVFFALYWVLLETVELRHAPWMGWIQNLTAPDPYFVLPFLNLLVMFLTQRMTPTPGMDPMQKKMMQVMPLVFGVMMAFFPAGLVLYWVTNGGLGLLQQWWMTRVHGPKSGTGGTPPASKTVSTVSR